MIEQICTERLIMRRYDNDDCRDVYEYLSDKQVMRYIEEPFNHKQVEDFVNLFTCNNPKVYGLVEKISNKVIGHVIFHPYEYDSVYEIGWILNKNYHGKGYAFEISKELIKYGFEKLELHRIFATTVKGNTVCCHLLEKLNMHREAVFRKANFDKGGWIDEYWYAILEEDYFNGANK
jgi:[ribosomal protein S5]-alanine N-acetyltransferase